MEKEPALPQPVYAPELVAQAILYAAQHPRREAFIGAGAKLMAAGAYYMPRTMDRIMRSAMFRMQKSDRSSARDRRDALHASDPKTELRQRNGVRPFVAERSPYTAVSLRSTPLTRLLIGSGALLAAWTLTRRAAR